MFYLLNEGYIRPSLIPTLRNLIKDTRTSAEKTGSTLRCSILFGSVIGKSFIPKKSDVNVLVVFNQVDTPLLKELRGVFRKYLPTLKAFPVVIDEEYIRDSADVFPMEFLEWKERHILIYGENLLSGMEVSSENLRHEIEENLRGKKLRLIQAYFEVASGKSNLQKFMETTLPNFVVVFRNLLRLMGIPAPEDTPSMLDTLSEICKVRFPSVKRLHHLKIEGLKIKPDEAEILFKGYLREISDVTLYIDELKTSEGKVE